MLMLISKCLNSQIERSHGENYMEICCFMKAGVHSALYNSLMEIKMENFNNVYLI